MKKRIPGIFMAAVFLLLISCGPDAGTGPVKTPENANTPTPIVVPTCTPTAGPTPDQIKVPKVTPTKAVTPTATVTPEPSATPTATVTPEPSATPTAQPTPESTVSPTQTPTPSPEPTEEPTPTITPTPEPTATPIPLPSPTPAVNPDLLVHYGWQKTVSILGEYEVVFPELFRECTVEKTDSELIINYICDENEEILFQISYVLQKSLEESIGELLRAEGALLEGTSGDKRVVCQWEKNGIVNRGILLEVRYPQELLGVAFGEEEWTTGRMAVVFSYPADKRAEYETMDYNFYVIENREE